MLLRWQIKVRNGFFLEKIDLSNDVLHAKEVQKFDDHLTIEFTEIKQEPTERYGND